MADAAPPFICRFAPSPNGRLHLGHAFSALVNHAAARQAGGIYLVRIENIDVARCRPEFEGALMEDLAWLGASPDAPPRRQSEHFEAYAVALARLEAMGLVYPAFESRSEIARRVLEVEEETGRLVPRDPDGVPLVPFARTAMTDSERVARRTAGEPHVLRLDMAAALRAIGPRPLFWREAEDTPLAPPQAATGDAAGWGDVILARRDTPASYHLAVVVDDAAQAISHVIRGADLKPATCVHVLLQRLLGLPTPIYHHHRLILDGDGLKLSKSNASTSLAALRDAGMSLAQVRARIGLASPQPTPST